MKKLLRVFSWLLLSSLVIIIGSYIYGYYLTGENTWLNTTNLGRVTTIQSKEETNQQNQEVQTVIESEDARGQIIAKFLERYDSPLQPYDYYGAKLVEIADRYQVDFRLLPAIAMQESNLCKTVNPNAPHNCLGFGIHKTGTLDFDSYEDGFERAGKELKAYYIDQGLVTVEQIESKYTPSSNGSWAASVNQWMAEMRYDDRQLGKESTDNASVVEFVNEKP